MRYACQFDPLHTRQGNPLPLELDLDAAAQFAGDFVLARWRSPYLQSYC